MLHTSRLPLANNKKEEGQQLQKSSTFFPFYVFTDSEMSVSQILLSTEVIE
jgi:hypothetical protein